MCGIAGLIHRRKTGDVGTEMTNMLKSLKHRGPDSTGFALYGQPKGSELVLRFKVAEQDEMSKGFDIHQQVNAPHATEPAQDREDLSNLSACAPIASHENERQQRDYKFAPPAQPGQERRVPR